MRLIDADALIEEIVRIDDLRKLSTATIGKALDAVPTIDAIPVEWIRAKMDEGKREADKGIGNAAFTLAVIAPMGYLINEWQKEQEAR